MTRIPWRHAAAGGSALAALGGLFVFARVQGGFFPWFLLYVCILLALYEWGTWGLSLRGVSVSRQVRATRLAAGQSLSVELTVQTGGSTWPFVWLAVTDQLPSRWRSAAGAERRLVPLWTRRLTFSYEVPGLARGCYTIGPAVIRSLDLFGLVHRHRLVAGQTEVVVYPKAVPVRGWLSLRPETLGLREATRQRSEDSTTVLGVRDYTPGDRFSRIHWRASARRGVLQSKEFERHVSDEILFCIDATRSSYPDAAPFHFELAMTIAASLVKHTYDMRRFFAWAICGASLATSGKGLDEAHYRHCLEALARANPGGDTPFVQGLRHIGHSAPAGSAIVVISPALGPESAVAVGELVGRMSVEWFVPLAQTTLDASFQRALRLLRQVGVRVHLLASPDALGRLGRGGVERAHGI
ncbi:DUF58 domain-containing protein [Alicyclobacillus shizuokensis]|uniref:DUF58 domain-containing protein n=1 Tax=Alicyclobacillus shizuokensis TaxID=392014 RepID=UPI000831B15B|nr:DUF58 domain-containing protein [Alicyclobacillus shizuokensis]MCL6626823.1 DUF58 domain-containing protein [Alicyclobacillus shizuokensis]